LGEMLAVTVDDVFTDPVAYRYTNGVQAIRLHLGNVGLCGPRAPVLRPGRVGLRLSKLTDAIEFRFRIAVTAHGTPFIACHPGFHDELGTEIDTSDLARWGQPCRRQARVSEKRDHSEQHQECEHIEI